MIESILVLVVGLSICIVGIVLAVQHISKKKKIELVGWTLLFCVFLYGIGLPLVFLSTYEGKNLLEKAHYIEQYDSMAIIYYGLLVCVMMSTIYIGWLLVNNLNIVIFKRNKNDLTKHSNSQVTNINKLIRFAWFLLFFSIVTYYLYTMAYGGFIGLLTYSKAIRAGVSDVPNQFSFFKQFGQFAIISAYIFFAMAIDKKISKNVKKGCYFGALLSGLFSLYVLFSWGGRGSILFLIFVYSLGYIYNKSELFLSVLKKNLKYITLLPVVFVIMSKISNSSGNLGVFTLMISTLSYHFIAFIVNFNVSTYRWFQDLLYTPLYFLPSSIWKNTFNIDTANSYTTYLVNGGTKGEVIGGRVVTGTAPNDFLTFSYMQANIIGVIVVSLLLGMFLRVIHNKIMTIKMHGIKWVLYSYCIVHIAIRTITGGDVSQVVIGNWAFFVSIVLFYFYKNFRIKST
ncbi:O-antigen polymerase [Sutcliffiella horikoshii]|uniref:O-antigen polymerase n=1 Tax=Sutcliffiella horikoshii TaxID=79883 RepID=UPI00384CBA84